MRHKRKELSLPCVPPFSQRIIHEVRTREYQKSAAQKRLRQGRAGKSLKPFSKVTSPFNTSNQRYKSSRPEIIRLKGQQWQMKQLSLTSNRVSENIMPSGVFLCNGLLGEIRPKGVPFSGFRYAGKGRDFSTNEVQKIRL